MKSTPIYIGEKIKEIMSEKGVTKAKLAKLLGVRPQSVDYLLKRKSVDTDSLYNISTVLNYDFFNLYRIEQTNFEQTNFDICLTKAKVLIEIELDKIDLNKLNLKDRIVQMLNKE
ncbi:transcriptional regulator [Bacteroidia bacterium]|nr:transcriptional regulator [Bacteroidia bacterium]